MAESKKNMPEGAEAFFHACESGKGWKECSKFVVEKATFSMQVVNALPGPEYSGINSIEAYCGFMEGICNNFKDCKYDVQTFGWDGKRNTAIVFGKFTAMEGAGPSDYVYTLHFDENDKIDSMTKIWNDAYAMSKMPAPPAGDAVNE